MFNPISQGGGLLKPPLADFLLCLILLNKHVSTVFDFKGMSIGKLLDTFIFGKCSPPQKKIRWGEMSTCPIFSF